MAKTEKGHGNRVNVFSGGDRMFLGMQDFDFCPNLITFAQIYP